MWFAKQSDASAQFTLHYNNIMMVFVVDSYRQGSHELMKSLPSYNHTDKIGQKGTPLHCKNKVLILAKYLVTTAEAAPASQKWSGH